MVRIRLGHKSQAAVTDKDPAVGGREFEKGLLDT
jgi:hypothetical protein